MPKPDFLYVWSDAVLSKNGPRKPLGRLLVMAFAKHMHPDGTGAWPGQLLLAQRTGMGLRTVKQHLADLERDGWITRERVAVAGKKWRLTVYADVIPHKEQGAPAAPTPSSNENRVQTVTEQGATAADQGADGGSFKGARAAH